MSLRDHHGDENRRRPGRFSGEVAPRRRAGREVRLRGLARVPTRGGGFRGEPRRAPTAGFNRRLVRGGTAETMNEEGGNHMAITDQPMSQGEPRRVSRRWLLRAGLGAAAGGAVATLLSACGGAETATSATGGGGEGAGATATRPAGT